MIAVKHYDVVIVGAGPAGALLGYYLARAGVAVVILERKILPRYKPCGGGLTARTLSALPFDIGPVIEDHTYQPMMLYNNQVVFQQKLDRPAIAMVMRDRFDHYLVEKAAGQGAAVCDNTAFRSVDGRPGDLKVTTSRGEFKTRIIVGADGVAGRVGRQLGLSIHRQVMLAVEGECHYADKSIVNRYTGTVHFDFGVISKGYGWVFPKKNHLSIGLVTLGRSGTGMQKDFKAYLALKGLAAGAVIRPFHGHLIPYRPDARSVLADQRGIVVGDAAGFTDPLTGEGIYYAVRGAGIAAKFVRNALNLGPEFLPGYSRAIKDAFLPDLIRADRMARVIYHCPPLSKMLLLKKGHELGRCQLDIIFGRKTYRQLFRDILRFWQHQWWRRAGIHGR